MKIFSLKLFSSIAALCLSVGAQATTTYNPANSQMNIDAILLGGSVFTNVNVTINSYTINSVGSGAPVNNSFDPASNILTLGTVTVVGTTYNNVSVSVNSYTLKGATPAGAAARCTAPQTLVVGINACVTPMGQKVYSANTLPTPCSDVDKPCWTSAVANGTVKWIATSALSTGASPIANSTRPIVFAYFSDYAAAAPSTGPLLWQVSPIYADSGTLVMPAELAVFSTPTTTLVPTLTGGKSSEIDWVIGTDQGLVVHNKASGLCYLEDWNQASNGWNTWLLKTPPAVACP